MMIEQSLGGAELFSEARVVRLLRAAWAGNLPAVE